MRYGIEYSVDPNDFHVKYNAPSRDFSTLREEFNIDAQNLKNLGPLYVLFSTGVDSQIIARCLIDNKIDAEYIFINYVNYSNELHRVHECEKFYGIDVRIIDIDLEHLKNEWIVDKPGPIDRLSYPFEYVSSILDKDYPIISQGANAPALAKNMIYCNYYESMQSRFRAMAKYRKIYDFPYSPEAISSYYCDDNILTFLHTYNYFYELEKDMPGFRRLQLFNKYCKPYLFGSYFKNELIWYNKLSGYENLPDWATISEQYITNTRVTVPYYDLYNFLKTERNISKVYSEWLVNTEIPGFITI